MANYDELRKQLLRDTAGGYDHLSETDRVRMEDYAGRYMHFLDHAKTERDAVRETIALAEAAGYRPYEPGMALIPDDKVYFNNHRKSIYLAHIGTRPLADGAHIAAAHIDSPRLDLKPNPLYEDAGMAFFKTNYYGGIKKYQWTTIPLALHGVVIKADGTSVDICIGEDEDDPVLYVTDLLIHLSADQMKKTLAEGITAEQLNLLVGSEPLADDEGGDRVKLAVVKLLNEKYGIVEADFQSAELIAVPAAKARFVGLDRSLIGSYGHDDRVCAFASLDPILRQDTPAFTSICLLADKEEIGSVGITGMKSHAFETFMEDLCQGQNTSLRRCLEHSFCISADVTNAFDPNFAETCDRRNSAVINGGIAVCKYVGSRGKSSTSDASAETVGYLRRMFNANDVIWQTATMGKVDQGGGGTVSGYMANRNIETIDAGVPVLSMHAPVELVSKLDAYMTAKAIAVFYAAEA